MIQMYGKKKNQPQNPTSDSTVEIKLTSDSLDFAAVTETSFGLKHIPKVCIDKCMGTETNVFWSSPSYKDEYSRRDLIFFFQE